MTLLLVSVFVEVDRVMECCDRGVDAGLSVSLYQSSPARHTEPRPGDLYKSEYLKNIHVFHVPRKCAVFAK